MFHKGYLDVNTQCWRGMKTGQISAIPCQNKELNPKKKYSRKDHLKADSVKAGIGKRSGQTEETLHMVAPRGVPRIFGGGGGGGPRSTKEANKPNKRATELKPCTCADQGSMFRPY